LGTCHCTCHPPPTALSCAHCTATASPGAAADQGRHPGRCPLVRGRQGGAGGLFHPLQ
jgi:hypothetical protein